MLNSGSSRRRGWILRCRKLAYGVSRAPHAIWESIFGHVAPEKLKIHGFRTARKTRCQRNILRSMLRACGETLLVPSSLEKVSKEQAEKQAEIDRLAILKRRRAEKKAARKAARAARKAARKAKRKGRKGKKGKKRGRKGRKGKRMQTNSTSGVAQINSPQQVNQTLQ